MRDRTAQTEPLTIGQQLVARWEGLNSGWSEPADLAEAIDAAIIAEREACAKAAEGTPMAFAGPTHGAWDRGYNAGRSAAAVYIRNRTE